MPDQIYSVEEPPNTEDVDTIVGWVLKELQKVKNQFGETISLELRLRGSAPQKPREGMIVAADGTNWNPGGGKGVYTWLAGAWVKMS